MASLPMGCSQCPQAVQLATDLLSAVVHILPSCCRFGRWHDTVHKLNWPATVTPERVDRLQDLLCNAHQSYCQGSNKQYDSVAACKAFLADVPALAPVYRLAGNNLYCRWVLHSRHKGSAFIIVRCLRKTLCSLTDFAKRPCKLHMIVLWGHPSPVLLGVPKMFCMQAVVCTTALYGGTMCSTNVLW